MHVGVRVYFFCICFKVFWFLVLSVFSFFCLRVVEVLKVFSVF